MAKICLMTPGQPSINPRLVKEADALAEAGHQVHVLCSHMVPWADAFDKRLLSTRNWTCSFVGGSRGSFLTPGAFAPWFGSQVALAETGYPTGL